MYALIPQRQVGHTRVFVTELGLGGAGFGNLHQRISDEDSHILIHRAVDMGIRYVDTAPFYGFGLSERRVGNALRGRTDTTISSKVGRLLMPDASVEEDAPRSGFHSTLPFTPIFDYRYDAIRRSWEDSLQRMGVRRIDILFVHDIGRQTHGTNHADTFDQLTRGGGLRALEELRAEQSVGAIGLGVNEIDVCLDVMKHIQLDAILLAGRYTLLEQEPLDALLPACALAGTSLIVGAPFNSGILASGTRRETPPRHNYAAASAGTLERVRRIEAICDRYETSLAAAALQFPLAHSQVVSVVPGIATLHELNLTLQHFNERIPSEFWSALKAQGFLRADAPTPHSRAFAPV